MYNLSIKGTNIELTEAISEYVKKKISMLETFVNPRDESVEFNVEVGKSTRHHRSGDIFYAEINAHIAGKNFYTTAEKDNLYASIDEVKDEIEREMVYYKDRRMSLIKKGAQKFKRMMRSMVK